MVIHNPEPDQKNRMETELQWDNGDLSGAVSPAELVKPTERAIAVFKQSKGYRQYLDWSRRQVKTVLFG